MPAGRYPPASTRVAGEVFPIFKFPARATSVARPGKSTHPTGNPAIVSPPTRATGGVRRPIHGSVLTGASILLLLAVVGSSGLSARLAPGAAAIDPPPAAAPALPDGPAPAAARPAQALKRSVTWTGAVEGITSAALPSSLDRWVSATTGSDAADGSQTRPWRTIQRAVASTPTGGVITVRGGTYAAFAVTRSGLVVQGATGETAIVSGSKYPVLVKGVTSATIRRLTIQKAPDLWGSGVRVEASTGVRIENNFIRDNHSFGIKVKDSTGVLIIGNEISANDTGIELSGAVGGTVISFNRIHHNNRMVTSSRGGNGIVFTKTTGLVRATSNQIWGNRSRHMTAR